MTSPLQLPGLSAGTWSIDPSHSEVGFQVRHLMVSKVKGVFEKFSGDIVIAEDALLSSVTAEIEIDSINTRDANRDNHLRSADFFEAGKYPSMTFTSTAVQPKGHDYVVTGDLTIKGITRSVELELEFNGAVDSPMGIRAGFSATTEINRKDFGVTIDMPLEGGGAVVGDKIKINLEIEAVKQA
jgi:polyisoprenoid-binding protein YceI